MPGKTAETLILGAGIAGCALAYHLARRGRSGVVVYDPRTPAAGASGRAAGIVTEQLWNSWDVEVTRESHREYASLARAWRPEAYQRNGFARWTHSPEIAKVLDPYTDQLRAWGVRIEEATPRDLERWYPAGRFDDVTAAIVGPDDGVVTPSALTTVYAEGARQSGAVFDFGSPMGRLARTEEGFLLATGDRSWTAARLVVAAGAWSKRILADLGHPQPLVPYRTQAALLRPPAPPPESFPSGHDLDTDVYLRPEANGRLLAGDGTEKVEADPERFVPGGDTTFLEHLGVSLAERFPGWSDSEVLSSWAGVCTATPDRRPLVGPVPGAPELFVLAGFNGFGVMRAGGIARRLADLLVDGGRSDSPRSSLAPVWPGRFLEPSLSFPPKPGFTIESGDDPRF